MVPELDAFGVLEWAVSVLAWHAWNETAADGVTTFVPKLSGVKP